MNLLAKLQRKLAGEDPAPATTAASPQQAVEALEHLPDKEKVLVLDYIQSVQALKTTGPNSK